MTDEEELAAALSEPTSQQEPSFSDKAKAVYEHLKTALSSVPGSAPALLSSDKRPVGDRLKTAAGEFAQAGQSAPGTPQAMAAMTGALGPATIAAPTLAALLTKGQGGDFSQRMAIGQQGLSQNMANNPGSAMGGALLGGLAVKTPQLPGSAALGGVPIIGKALSGALNGAVQGGAQSLGLGGGIGPGAAIGGVLGGLGGAVGSAASALAKGPLNPILNRLKFLKPSAEEAQPLSPEGQDIRASIGETTKQGLWKGLPSREGMLDRLTEAQKPAGEKIGQVLQSADNASDLVPRPVDWSNRNSVLSDLGKHSAASGDNLPRLQNIAQQESENVAGAGSLTDLNRAKQNIYQQTYNQNTPEMGERFLPGRDKLLRAMGRDVKSSIVDQVKDASQIDPRIDANGLQSANKQYGTLQTLINPLNKAVGKDIAGGDSSSMPGGGAMSMIGDMLSMGGRRHLAQAHGGEMLSKASGVAKFLPPDAVAKAFIAGTTPSINKKEADDEDRMQP